MITSIFTLVLLPFLTTGGGNTERTELTVFPPIEAEAGLDFALCDNPVMNLTVSAGNCGATVTWDEIPDALGYQVQLRQVGGGISVQQISLDNVEYICPPLNPGTQYEWRVRAKCSDGSITPFSVIENFFTGIGLCEC